MQAAGRGRIVNTRKELLGELKKAPSQTLVLSHCVNSLCYNTATAKEIARMGSVVSPGEYTAPGSLFSSKLKTYRMLTEKGGEKLIADYSFIDPGEKTAGEVAGAILDAAEKDSRTDKFFIKPTTGGGGLGGFRLSKKTIKGRRYFFLPDMSRLSGRTGKSLMEPLNIDPQNRGALEELWWIYKKFSSSPVLKKNYIHVKLQNSSDLAGLLKQKPLGEWVSRYEAENKLASAIKLFEKKFTRRYAPLVNHHIDFGTWGLRAHYRLGRKGIILETAYARIFQIRFSPRGIGYVGADNISNKQTGELELDRLVPINPVMTRALGGENNMFDLLRKGADAFRVFIKELPPELRDKVPLRVQFDIAPVDGYICEGNADTARGFCLAQNFNSFVQNAREWYRDSLDFYSYVKSNRK